MNRIIVCLCAALLISSAAFTQTFPDLPTGHWAYDAVQELANDGIINGYPDGTFKGNRNLTRYEFAIALRDALASLKFRMAALEAKSGVVKPGETITRVETKLDPKVAEDLAKLKDDYVKMQKLTTEFQDELAALGVDVEALKKETSDLQKRVDAIEKEMARIQIGGTIDFIARGTQMIDNKSAIDKNGIPTQKKSLMSDMNVLHELGLNITGQLSETTRADATIVVGNFLNYLGSPSMFSASYNDKPATDVVIWKATVNTPVSIFGKQSDLTVGRYENTINPLLMRKPVVDWYNSIDSYANGLYSMDGAKLDTNWGAISLGLWAGKNNTVGSNLYTDNMMMTAISTLPVNGQSIRIAWNNMDITQSAGVKIGIQANENISLKLNYAQMGYDTMANGEILGLQTGPTNRLGLYGADLLWNDLLPRTNVYANYAQSDLMKGDSTKLSSKNYAIMAGFRYGIGESGYLGIGYREFAPYFISPGYWVSLGSWINPTGIKGVIGELNWKTSKLDLLINGGYFEGIRTTEKGVTSPFTPQDKLGHIDANLAWKMTDTTTLGVEYEAVLWDLKNYTTVVGTRTRPYENYVTVYGNMAVAENTSLKLMYQLIDVNTKGNTYFEPGLTDGTILGRYQKAGVALAQLSVKF
ncbi:MAG: S-layer homology domain-containing protein [Armatimonadota bacterium]